MGESKKDFIPEATTNLHKLIAKYKDFPYLGDCIVCGRLVFKVTDEKCELPYFAVAKGLRGIRCSSAKSPGTLVACHSSESCMSLFKQTTTGKAYFGKVPSGTTAEKSSPMCEFPKCPRRSTIKRTLKNGCEQYCCEPCLNSYYEARDTLREEAIEYAGGLEHAQLSATRTDGTFIGKCMECNGRVLDTHKRMKTCQNSYVHIGCLG
jgi:hypothetical protein